MASSGIVRQRKLSIDSVVKSEWNHRARSTDPSPELFAAVRLALDDDPDAPTDAPTVDGLARIVLEHLPADVAYLFGGDLDPHALDLRLLDWLEARGLGEKADRLRGKARDRHAEVEQPELFRAVVVARRGDPQSVRSARYDPVRWKWWMSTAGPTFLMPSGVATQHPPPALVFLAIGRWHEGRRTREEHERRKAPALLRSIQESIGAVAEKGGRLGDLVHLEGGHGDAPRVPTVPEDLARFTRGGHELFGTELFGLFIRWLVLEQWRSRLDERGIRVVGGWAELARRLGRDDRTAQDNLRKIALAMFASKMEFGDGRSQSMIAMLPELREVDEAPGRRATIWFGIGPTWSLPGSVFNLPGDDRRLVPVTTPPSVASVNPRYRGAALRLDWLAWGYLRDHAAALLTGQALLVPWRELAEQAEIPWSQAEPLIREWAGPGGRWRELADGWVPRETPETSAALQFLREGAEKTERGRRNGIASAAKRKADGPRAKPKKLQFGPRTPKVKQ